MKNELDLGTSLDQVTRWLDDDRPHFAKVDHFLRLGLFDALENNEWRVKIQLRKGTYNPDFYHRATNTYIEVTTSIPNISEQRNKWREAMNSVNLRVFWWEGLEITDAIRDGSQVVVKKPQTVA